VGRFTTTELESNIPQAELMSSRYGSFGRMYNTTALPPTTTTSSKTNLVGATNVTADDERRRAVTGDDMEDEYVASSSNDDDDDDFFTPFGTRFWKKASIQSLWAIAILMTIMKRGK
jgi:hypothetical protein